MQYKRLDNGIIEVYRNKRKPIKRVKEKFKNEDGCLACALFDICLGLGWKWTNAVSSMCEAMEDMGVVEPDEKGDRFFIDAGKNS